MPGPPKFDTKKIGSFLSHIIGHEGKNSLLSYLISNKVALSLSAGPGNRLNQSISIFTVDIALTEEGEKDYKRVIEMVYMYINQLKLEGP